MGARDYCGWVRTIEEIRLDNYRLLIAELERNLGRPPMDVEVAAHLGISKVYVHQLNKGKRASMQSPAARKIEEQMDKPRGWMDADHKLWPFPGIDADRLHALTYEQRIEIQGLLREWVEKREDLGNAGLRNGTSG